MVCGVAPAVGAALLWSLQELTWGPPQKTDVPSCQSPSGSGRAKPSCAVEAASCVASSARRPRTRMLQILMITGGSGGHTVGCAGRFVSPLHRGPHAHAPRTIHTHTLTLAGFLLPLSQTPPAAQLMTRLDSSLFSSSTGCFADAQRMLRIQVPSSKLQAHAADSAHAADAAHAVDAHAHALRTK
jgi:hypothetical protein